MFIGLSSLSIWHTQTSWFFYYFGNSLDRKCIQGNGHKGICTEKLVTKTEEERAPAPDQSHYAMSMRCEERQVDKTVMRVFVKDDRGMLSAFLVLGSGRSRGTRWVGGI